jgi:hypothetical protein
LTAVEVRSRKLNIGQKGMDGDRARVAAASALRKARPGTAEVRSGRERRAIILGPDKRSVLIVFPEGRPEGFRYVQRGIARLTVNGVRLFLLS